MRALTKKEKRLSVIFLATLFVAVNLVLLQSWLQQTRQLRTDLVRLDAEREQATLLASEEPYWREARQWMSAHLPRLTTSVQEASSGFLETILESARDHRLTVTDRALPETPPNERYQETAVRLSVEAEMEDLVRWLAELQQPGEFVAVTHFSLRQADEGSKVTCELQIARWYAPPEEL